MPLRFIGWMLSAGLLALGSGMVCGQTTSTGSGQAYPNRPVRIVTSQPGGGTDFTARLIALGMSGPLGQPVIVDNRSGVIPGEIAAKAPPDGYTLLVAAGTLWIGPLMQNTPYDPVRDFSPITVADSAPQVLVVHPSVAAHSVKELIALAKARPGELNYASTGTGGSTHLATELFKAMAGVNIVRISYKGTAQALNDLIAGQVQLQFANAGAVVPHVKSGRLRALAVTSAQPSALAPGLPTVATTGLPGYESEGMTGVFAPARTPGAVINRLNQEIVRVLSRPDVKEKFFNAGSEALGSSPEQLAAAIKSQMGQLGKVIKDAGIRVE